MFPGGGYSSTFGAVFRVFCVCVFWKIFILLYHRKKTSPPFRSRYNNHRESRTGKCWNSLTASQRKGYVYVSFVVSRQQDVQANKRPGSNIHFRRNNLSAFNVLSTTTTTAPTPMPLLDFCLPWPQVSNNCGWRFFLKSAVLCGSC